MEVAIIINVSKKAHICRRGPLGTYIVPPAVGKYFGMLVVRATSEIQDVGNNKRTRGEVILPRLLAKDIIGDEGEQHGMYICSMEPDEPKSLERAEREEREYLNTHPYEVKQRLNQMTKMRELSTGDEPEVKDMKIKMSKRVAEEREKFDAACRKMVLDTEIEKAQSNLVAYYQRLVQEGNRLWSREVTRSEVNEHHKFAAVELGLDDLPWNNTPIPREDCPGCGEAVKLNIAMCPRCNAILDEEKARKLWPEKYAKPQQNKPAA